jgi:hypothetical protein
VYECSSLLCEVSFKKILPTALCFRVVPP